jgi:hypothetical protein
MDGRRYSGNKTVTVTVTVGPTYISTAMLKVTANGRADVVFNPGEANFGIVAQGSTPSRTVDVEYAGPLKWTITEVNTGGGPFTAEAKELYRRPGQVGYRVTITLKPDAPAGIIKNEVLIKTNDPASPTVPLQVEGIVQASLQIFPSALNLGSVKPGMPVVRKVIVRGSGPFRILKVDGLGDGIEVVGGLPSEARESHTLEVKVTLATLGLFRREVRITASTQDAPLTFTIDGVVMK